MSCKKNWQIRLSEYGIVLYCNFYLIMIDPYSIILISNIFISLFIYLLTSHTIFPLKTSLEKPIHMTMVHSKKSYERLGSLKDKYTKHFTKCSYISIF